MTVPSSPAGKNLLLPVRRREIARPNRRSVCKDLLYSVPSSSGIISSSNHGASPTAVAFQHPIITRKRLLSHSGSSQYSESPSFAHNTSCTSAPQSEFSFQSQIPPLDAQSRRGEVHRGLISSQEVDDHTDGPPVKKRRGMAGMLMDSVLTAALYTGAAAVTAYSIWSGWGKKQEDEEEQDNFRKNSRKILPAEVEEPPPPYMEERSSTPTQFKHDLSIRSPISPTRPSHIFVSSRRRRLAFQSVKTAQKSTPKRTFLFNSSSAVENSLLQPPESEAEGSEDDELFTRLQSQMSSLIEEGNRALSSKAHLVEADESTKEASASASYGHSVVSSFTPTSQQSIARQSNIPTSPIRFSQSVARQNRHFNSPTSRIPRLQSHKECLQ